MSKYHPQQRLEIYTEALRRITSETVDYIVYALWYSVSEDSLDDFEDTLELHFPELKGKDHHDGKDKASWGKRIQLLNECITEVTKLIN